MYLLSGPLGGLIPVLQWLTLATLATLAMFPVLLVVYRRLALREEREVAAEFGDSWQSYAATTPRFIPALRARVERRSRCTDGTT